MSHDAKKHSKGPKLSFIIIVIMILAATGAALGVNLNSPTDAVKKISASLPLDKIDTKSMQAAVANVTKNFKK